MKMNPAFYYLLYSSYGYNYDMTFSDAIICLLVSIFLGTAIFFITKEIAGL